MSLKSFLGVLPVLALAFTSCVSRGFPTHGGGKRFWHEQEIVSQSIDSAIGQMDIASKLDALGPDKPARVGLVVLAVADSGGGVQATSGGFSGAIGGLFGAGGELGGAPAVGYGGASYTTPQTAYGSFAFSSSEDIAYLRGKVIEALASSSVAIGSTPSGDERRNTETQGDDGQAAVSVDGVVYVLVDQLGIDRRDMNILIYNKYDLRARARMRAFYVQLRNNKVANYKLLGEGAGEWHYAEDYIFGIGPLRSEQAVKQAAEY